MEILFLGVGEAFDPDLSNSSYLVSSTTNMLIDCGYAVPQRLFALRYPKDFIDAVYLTHTHADHSFGLPALLVRAREERREKPLTIIGQPGTRRFVEQLVELAYPGNFAKLPFKVSFVETIDPYTLNEMKLSFAPTVHSISNYAIRIECDNECVAFSGDGELTAEAEELYRGCSLLVHEAYTLDGHVQSHTSANEVAEAVGEFPKLQQLAFVHINRQERRERLREFEDLNSHFPPEILIPEPGFLWRS